VYSFAIAMSKRKTRKEKVISELRRKLATNQPTQSSQTFVSTHQYAPTTTYATTVLAHHYLKKDLLKTFFLTSAIVAIELILFIFTK
jgi:hypothetical protein